MLLSHMGWEKEGERDEGGNGLGNVSSGLNHFLISIGDGDLHFLHERIFRQFDSSLGERGRWFSWEGGASR